MAMTPLDIARVFDEYFNQRLFDEGGLWASKV